MEREKRKRERQLWKEKEKNVNLNTIQERVSSQKGKLELEINMI